MIVIVLRYAIAFLLSLLLCGAFDWSRARSARVWRKTVAERRAELAAMAARDAEVLEFQAERKELEERINWINALKANQRVASRPLAIAAALDPGFASIESIAVEQAALTIYGHAQSAKEVEQIENSIANLGCEDVFSVLRGPKYGSPQLTRKEILQEARIMAEIQGEPDPASGLCSSARVIDRKMHTDCGPARKAPCVAYLIRAEVTPVQP